MIRATNADVLIRRLERTPGNITLAVRVALSQAGQVVVAQARANAGWSSRIPAAMSARASVSASGSRVVIRVDRARAPHARPFEGLSGRTFRHPLFGDRAHWYPQSSRPFLRRAREQKGSEVEAIIAEAISKAVAAGGA